MDDVMIIVSVFVFVVLMLIVGIIVSRKIKDADDFFLGGRKTPAFLIVSTLIATEVGGGVMLGSVGYGYGKGWGALWYLVPIAVGLVLFGLIMAQRLKKDGDENGSSTMFEWLTGRFNNDRAIRTIGGIVMLAGFVGSMAAQFLAMGTALSTITHVPHLYGLLIGGLAIIVYSSLGGLLSVMWTDLLQAAVFIFGMVVFLPMILSNPAVGGFGNLMAFSTSNYPPALLAGTASWRWSMLITMGVAPFVRQYYYQRMFASNSPKTARNSMFLQAALIVIIAVWTCLVGMSVAMINPLLDNPESAMPWALAEVMPPIVAAIVMGAITACIMSTADTFLNAGSLTFVRDVVGSIREEPLDKVKELKLARISSFTIGIVGLLLAVSSSSIMSAILKAWAILGGGLFVPMVISYFWKRSTRTGVIYSMVVGLLVTLGFTLFSEIPAIFIGIPASLAALIIGSLVTKKHEQDKVAA